MCNIYVSRQIAYYETVSPQFVRLFIWLKGWELQVDISAATDGLEREFEQRVSKYCLWFEVLE